MHTRTYGFTHTRTHAGAVGGDRPRAGAEEPGAWNVRPRAGAAEPGAGDVTEVENNKTVLRVAFYNTGIHFEFDTLRAERRAEAEELGVEYAGTASKGRSPLSAVLEEVQRRTEENRGEQRRTEDQVQSWQRDWKASLPGHFRGPETFGICC